MDDSDRYEEAVALCRQNRKPSMSYIQRKLHMRFDEAARYIDRMELAGLCSRANSAGKREWLEPSERAKVQS